MSKVHLYGWDWVKKYIPQVPNNHILIDYAEHYFFNPNNTYINTYWFCIIHHTITNTSPNNLNNLFTTDIFIKSLVFCRCIITLSEYNKNEIIKLLNKMNLVIPVEVVYHPINLSDNLIKFNKIRFITNPNKSIINIGAWLRNPYTIYTLYLPNLSVKKFKLKGKYMSEYFMPTNYNIISLTSDIFNNNNLNDDLFETEISDISNLTSYESIPTNNLFNKLFNKLSYLTLQNSSSDIVSNVASRNIIYSRSNTNINYYILYLFEYIKSISNTILNKSRSLSNTPNLIHEYDLRNILIRNDLGTGELDYKDDTEYIKLFNNNIIFGHYIDCSASNTILECIMCNTPIIVNNHPAIMEYLGKDYPLYYSNPIYDSDYKFILDFTFNDINNANHYLSRLDKTKFLPETFNKKMSEIFSKYSKKSKNKFNYKSFNICACFSKNKS